MPTLIEGNGTQAVLFDIDGTLVDSVPMIRAGLKQAYREFAGLELDDLQVEALIGKPLAIQMSLFGLGNDPKGLALRVKRTIELYAENENLLRPFDEALTAFTDVVSSPLKTALITSRNAEELAHIQNLFPILQQADASICASDVQHPKPHPESALLACSQLGVEPRSTVFVGDSLHDLECAHSAGCPFWAVGYGASPSADLAAHQPAELFCRPAELESALRQLMKPTHV